MIMVSIQLNARFYKNDYSSKVQMTNEHFRNRSKTYLKQKQFFFDSLLFSMVLQDCKHIRVDIVLGNKLIKY